MLKSKIIILKRCYVNVFMKPELVHLEKKFKQVNKNKLPKPVIIL